MISLTSVPFRGNITINNPNPDSLGVRGELVTVADDSEENWREVTAAPFKSEIF
jgi:hypothetical protein